MSEPIEGGAGLDEVGRLTIRVVGGELPNTVSLAETALIKANHDLFQRSGFLVRIVARPEISTRTYMRPAGLPGLTAVQVAWLVDKMTAAANFERFDKRSEKYVAINCPEQIASVYLSRAGQWAVPELAALIGAPTLRPDGSLLDTPGYDRATRLYFDPGGIEFPRIAKKPSKAAAKAALGMIRRLLASFPFQEEMDEAVAAAAILTALVRRSLPSAPLIGISAPSPATGKTLLADVIAIILTGRSAPAMSWPKTDEEAAKTALAVLLEGDAVVLIDNVERTLRGDWLCSVLTSETYKQRLLGRSESIVVPTNTLFLATGNHLNVAGDLRTRTLLSRLDAKVESPERRSFSFDLRETATNCRPELVMAGLTIMRAFIADKVRADDYVPAWGRFEKWSQMVRAPLVWLGLQDPCASLHHLESEDPDRRDLVRLLSAWLDAFEGRPGTARDAIDIAERETAVGATPSELTLVLRDLAGDRGGEINARRLGKFLQFHQGVRVDGLMLVKRGERKNVALWEVARC